MNEMFKGYMARCIIMMIMYAMALINDSGNKADNEGKWESRRLENFATWQEAYIDFINELDGIIPKDEGFEYSLIYVDNDAVPELYINTKSGAGGEIIASFYDGKVRAMNRERGGIQYIEYGGLMYSTWGNMGFYPCNVYMLEKGEFLEIGTGWVSERYDEENEDIRYEYFWEEREVTQAEYEECINELIDTSKCVEPSLLYSEDEILEMLTDS